MCLNSTESFKIYPSFTLTAVTLESFSAEFGADDVSVVGYTKIFHPSGSGILAGDLAKWVSASVTNDAGCVSEKHANESLVMISSEYTSTHDEPSTKNLASPLEASFMFTAPTIGAAELQLCYKHQIEPYHLHADLKLGTRQLVSASVRALGIEQTLVSITNSPQPVSFVAYGGMEGDRYKWVQQFSSSSISESVMGLDRCAEEVEPAAGSSVGIAAGFYQEASFAFSEPASSLLLCYGPGVEPYMAYPAMTMEVLSPVISAANRTHVIVGRSTNVRLVGTFGITSGDALKLAENVDGDCEGTAAGGDKAVFYPYATAAGLTDPTTGTSDVTVLVSERTQENRPFRICYRFGQEGAWELFDTVSWEAFEVVSVDVNVGDGSPAAGDLLGFTFTGTGVVDGGKQRLVSRISWKKCSIGPLIIRKGDATHGAPRGYAERAVS